MVLAFYYMDLAFYACSGEMAFCFATRISAKAGWLGGCAVLLRPIRFW